MTALWIAGAVGLGAFVLVGVGLLWLVDRLERLEFDA
jgi:hypothetical protein